ncbi:MAG TPA: hypothetical protein PK447_05210 [Ignavibacteria bacterium]|nr:hypothetical protein [Ignavibacteria bacterium]
MNKVLFEFRYQVYPEKVEDYLHAIQKIKGYAQEALKGKYYVYRSNKDNDTFNEIFVCDSEEDYENFEDGLTDEMRDVFEEIMSDYVVDSMVSYQTYTEI